MSTIPVNGGRDNMNNENHATVGFQDETSRLKDLHAEVRDQDDVERDIGRQADRLLIEQADERDRKRLEKTNLEKDKLLLQIRKLQQRLNQPQSVGNVARLQAEIDIVMSKVGDLDTDLKQINERIEQRHQHEGEDDDSNIGSLGTVRLANESQRDFLIRTGKITPFSQVGTRSVMRSTSNLEDALLDAEEDPVEEVDFVDQLQQLISHRHLLRPGFAEDESNEVSAADDINPPRKKRRLHTEREARVSSELKGAAQSSEEVATPGSSPLEDTSDAPFEPEIDDYGQVKEESSGGEGEDSDYEVNSIPDTQPQKKATKNKKKEAVIEDDIEDLRGVDDGREDIYQRRLQNWVVRRRAARKRAQEKKADAILAGQDQGEAPKLGDPDVKVDEEDLADVTDQDEWHLPHPKIDDTIFEGGFRIPGDIYPFLFDYQKTGVQWLWELYFQQVGGIIGDEMGLGKTIQIIAFLAGLHYSKKLKKPIIVVCPATVMKQWVNEFHRWWPPFRVSILHTSGSGMINVKRESRREDNLLEEVWNANGPQATRGQKAAKEVVKRVAEEGHVLVTTYSGLQSYARLLIPAEWAYAVLDEGHKIRNPNTSITIYCKELQTHNRVILSGTPMQNNLTELWSLFDFVFPMRLGTLVSFRNQFEIPIRQGGYANASNLQVQTALRCAETLKDAISPYLLQRFKVDVVADLPKKSEQVLFCRLTKIQRQAYELFLGSDDMRSIMSGRRQVLYGIDILRKICNHPDLEDHKRLSVKSTYNYGSGTKSGKMQVVKSLLELWRDTGHKALLFAQHRIMLDILEKFIKSMDGMRYRRMDGNTPIATRQSMVDEFNNNSDLHVFLLTTKVGGLGVNLTGADRVIIYDPDWNPSTDLQARERAWRLGQKREVAIYRLMTAGTIEEKIYHRQIFKQFLTNKILRDPKQRQTFQMSNLHDLFSLGDENEGPTETTSIFKDAEVKYDRNPPNTTADNTTTNANALATQPASLPPPPDPALTSVPGISSIAPYRPSFSSLPHPTSQADPSAANIHNSDDRVLSSIFARSGVHSALEHDTIINGRKHVAADPHIIEREAKKVAAEAARELARAANLARDVPIGIPTWTGQVGVTGRPNETTPQHAFASSRQAGPSSSSILANLAAATGTPADYMFSSPQSTAATGTPPASLFSPSQSNPLSRPSTPQNLNSSLPTAPKGKDFAPLIRDFLKAHGGKAHTQMLIDHFNRFCTSPVRTAEFKEMLKAVATLEKPAVRGGRGGAGRGRWVLRPEFW